jgi:hypothetical protein
MTIRRGITRGKWYIGWRLSERGVGGCEKNWEWGWGIKIEITISVNAEPVGGEYIEVEGVDFHVIHQRLEGVGSAKGAAARVQWLRGSGLGAVGAAGGKTLRVMAEVCTSELARDAVLVGRFNFFAKLFWWAIRGYTERNSQQSLIPSARERIFWHLQPSGVIMPVSLTATLDISMQER